MHDVNKNIQGLSIKEETRIYEEIRYWERKERTNQKGDLTRMSF